MFSILSEHIGFSVPSMWSVFVLFLGPAYGLDAGQKSLLTTIPTAVGAVLRLPYTFAVARVGGRNWTIVSAALLVVPCVLTGLVLRPGVSFSTLLAGSLCRHRRRQLLVVAGEHRTPSTRSDSRDGRSG